MRKITLFLIRLYRRFISPYLAHSCRFYPSCSCYAEKAIEKHGAFVGIFLGLMRILRCNPFSVGGHDPVPDKLFHVKQLANKEGRA